MKNYISISRPLTHTNSNVTSTIKKNNTKNYTHHFKKISTTETNFYKYKKNFATSNDTRKTSHSKKNFALSQEKRNYSLNKKDLIEKCNILKIDYNKIKVNKKFIKKKIFSPINHKNFHNTNRSYIKIININVDMKKIKKIQQWWKLMFKIIKIQKQIKAFLLHKKIKLLLKMNKFIKVINNIYYTKILKVLNNDKITKFKKINTNKNKAKSNNYKRVFSPKQNTRLSRNYKANFHLRINSDNIDIDNSMINMSYNTYYSQYFNFISNKNYSKNKNMSKSKKINKLKNNSNKFNKNSIITKNNKINNIIHSSYKSLYNDENINIINIMNKLINNNNNSNDFYHKDINDITNNNTSNNINFRNTPPNTMNTNNNSSKFNNSIVINNSNDTISIKSNNTFKQKMIFENVKLIIKSKRYFNHWYNIIIKKKLLNKLRSIFYLINIIKKNIFQSIINYFKNFPKKKKNFTNNSMIDLQPTDTSVSNTNTFDFYSVKTIKINKILSNKIYILSFIINMVIKINKKHLLRKCFQIWNKSVKNNKIDSKIIKFSKTPSMTSSVHIIKQNSQNNNQNNKPNNNKIIYQKKLLKNSLNKKNFCNEILRKKSLRKIEERQINFSPGVSRKLITNVKVDNKENERKGVNCRDRSRDELNNFLKNDYSYNYNDNNYNDVVG